MAGSALIAPATIWCHLGRNGVWLQHTCDTSSQPRALRFTKVQAQAVGRIQLVNQVANVLHRQGQPYGHERDANIDAALLHAKTAGLTADDDLIAYAVRAMRSGRTFTHHEALPRWVQRTQEFALPFEEVVAAAWIISNED